MLKQSLLYLTLLLRVKKYLKPLEEVFPPAAKKNYA